MTVELTPAILQAENREGLMVAMQPTVIWIARHFTPRTYGETHSDLDPESCQLEASFFSRKVADAIAARTTNARGVAVCFIVTSRERTKLSAEAVKTCLAEDLIRNGITNTYIHPELIEENAFGPDGTIVYETDVKGVPVEQAHITWCHDDSSDVESNGGRSIRMVESEISQKVNEIESRSRKFKDGRLTFYVVFSHETNVAAMFWRWFPKENLSVACGEYVEIELGLPGGQRSYRARGKEIVASSEPVSLN